MTRALHTPVVALLLLAYVTTGSALALSSFAPLIVGGGSPALTSCDGKKPDLPRPSFVQRRHMPLVKLLTLSPVIPAAASYDEPSTDVDPLPSLDVAAGPADPLLRTQPGRSPPSA